MEEKGVCPVCGEHTFTKWDEYCPVCNWYHNFLQEIYPDDKRMDNILAVK